MSGGAEQVRLGKVKRPAGLFWFGLRAVGEDRHGTWLRGEVGSPWGAPHADGRLSVPVVVLLREDRPWATWWVADPADRRIELDVCLPPERTGDGWSYVDLELDVVRHDDGRVEIQDEDEYEQSVRAGWMSPEEAARARGAAAEGVRLLQGFPREPLALGWRLLSDPAAAPDPGH